MSAQGTHPDFESEWIKSSVTSRSSEDPRSELSLQCLSPLVHKKGSADVSTFQHLKDGVHYHDIYGNKDGGPPLTIGIVTITKHDSGAPAGKAPGDGYFFVTEGEISVGDTATPGHNPVLEPGDVIRVDKGTIITLSSPSSGKAFYVSQHEFGSDLKNHLV